MTESHPALRLDEVTELIAEALRPAEPGRGSVGLEVEWIVIDRAAPARPVPGDEVMAAADGALPAGGSLGVEPGGQLELSTLRLDGPTEALAAAAIDEAELDRRMASAGLLLLDTGLDPFRPPIRSSQLARYRAMESAFDARGPAGRLMMCSTASLQVNVDLGADPMATWKKAGVLAPVLAAAFANSPRWSAAGTVLASARAAIWAAIDPSRTRPVTTTSLTAWVDYALDAEVLFVERGSGAVPVAGPFTLRDWIVRGDALGGPDSRDVATHLTTLFPPVRPKGWIECRFLDALPTGDRVVAVHALVALLGDDVPLDRIAAACSIDGDPWRLVPGGTASPVMAAAVERCLDLAVDALERGNTGASGLVQSWIDRRHAERWSIHAPSADLMSLHHVEQENP